MRAILLAKRGSSRAIASRFGAGGEKNHDDIWNFRCDF